MEKNRNEIPVADMEIEPFTLLRDIVSNAVFILLGALAAAMLSYVLVSVRYVPQYTTSATFVVGSKESNNSYANLSSANTMATTLQKVLESAVMKKTICEEMKVDEIDADITTEVLEGTNLLVLSVTTDNPKDSIDIIRIIMEHYSDVAIFTVGNAVMNVLEEPDIPYAPDNYLDTRGAVKKGFLAGVLFCICLFGLLSFLKNSVKQEKEIEKKLDARSLGAISYEYKYKTVRDFIKHRKGSVLVDNPISSFPFVESYKKLASKVEYQMGKGDRKVLVVTSVSENEGKSTVAANLAITLAEQGKKVILLDGDIRRPSQFLIFQLGIDEKNELGEFLKGTGNLQDIMLKTDRKNLYFLGGRNCYSSSTELIQTEKLPKMLNACRKYADYVIIDTPPAGLLGDAQIFALASDAVLLVARQNYMLAEDINDILDEFRANGSKILGVVLNGVQSFSNMIDSSGRYGKYGRYGSYYNKGRG
ncbi:MAG: polysaccharide biosynthesis tyrosine autokinase [Dorea sp.]